MNKWKGSKSWVLVWFASFLMGGLILYKGYQSSLTVFTPERATKITNQTAQVVSRTTQDAQDNQVTVSKSSIKVQEIQEEQGLLLEQSNLSEKPLNIKDFPSPVQGKILRCIGNYYLETSGDYLYHTGVDYAEPEGTMIRATHGGKVVSLGIHPLLGQKVTLDCGEGWLVTYGGLDNLRVQDGETVVTQGALGQVGFFPGTEGQSNQSQLHYEVWHGDEIQRP